MILMLDTEPLLFWVFILLTAASIQCAGQRANNGRSTIISNADDHARMIAVYFGARDLTKLAVARHRNVLSREISHVCCELLQSESHVASSTTRIPFLLLHPVRYAM